MKLFYHQLQINYNSAEVTTTGNLYFMTTCEATLN